jgi:hypothetical protein
MASITGDDNGTMSAHSSSDPMLDLRKAVADSKQKYRSGLSGELGKLKRPRGGYSTEVSLTIRDPELNKNRWTNIPSLVLGQINVHKILAGDYPKVSPRQKEIAIKRALERQKAGAEYRSYDTVAEAEQAAMGRSKGKDIVRRHGGQIRAARKVRN